MTPSHKEALAKGRDHGRAVANYLEALKANKPKRGRKRTPESMNKRLAKIEEELKKASQIKQLQLIQERMDLRAELATYGTKKDISDAEGAFIEVAAAYSEAKGITFRAWRAMGVSAEILDKAGVPREFKI
jgi:hypothetical protein